MNPLRRIIVCIVDTSVTARRAVLEKKYNRKS